MALPGSGGGSAQEVVPTRWQEVLPKIERPSADVTTVSAGSIDTGATSLKTVLGQRDVTGRETTDVTGRETIEGVLPRRDDLPRGPITIAGPLPPGTRGQAGGLTTFPGRGRPQGDLGLPCRPSSRASERRRADQSLTISRQSKSPTSSLAGCSPGRPTR